MKFQNLLLGTHERIKCINTYIGQLLGGNISSISSIKRPSAAMLMFVKKNYLLIVQGISNRNTNDKYSENSAHLKMALKLLLRVGV